MRSPRDMQIIQIELTNACLHECSNCTRFCGHHKKNFFMDWDTYKRAVDSLQDFKGTIGIMGGEPTLHPEFERFVTYLNEKIKYKKCKNDFIVPSVKFMDKIHRQEIENRSIHKNVYGKDKNAVYGAGLWSALVPTYYKNFEIIQDVFNIQVLNDHSHIMYHSPILFSRKDMGINDEDWVKIRNNCWAQHNWSASITPKGAFFCEIAASLDILFDGPGGIPIEPGWWKKEPEEFNQYNWCELCGIALAQFTRNANDEIDDMSQYLYEKLKSIDSPKIKNGKYHIIKFDKNGKVIRDDEQLKEIREAKYWDDFSDRLDTNNKVLNPKAIDGLVICNNDDNLDIVIKNSELFDSLIVIVSEDYYDEFLLKKNEFLSKNIIFLKKDINHYGVNLNRAFKLIDEDNFILLFDEDVQLSNNIRERLMNVVLNPGTMHWSNLKEKCNSFVLNASELENANIALFSKKASSFRKIGFDNIASCKIFNDFVSLWEENKIIEFIDFNFHDRLPSIESNRRYVVYGTGQTAECVANKIDGMGSEVIYYCDSDSNKWGHTFNGKIIVSPNELLMLKNNDVKIIIASNFYAEIKLELSKIGIKVEDCIVIAN